MLRRILNLAPNDSAGGAATAQPPASAATSSAAKPSAAPSGDSAPPAVPNIDNPSDDKADMFSDLDASMATPPKAPDKPATPPVAKPGDKPADKPADAPQGTPVDKVDKTLQTPKALRDYANRTEAENKTLKSERDTLNAKISDFELKHKDTTKMVERVADLERQIQERDQRLYALNVGESPEFKEKYDKPWREAADYAQEIISLMEVATATDPESGEVTASRKATFSEDFIPIYNLAKQSLTRATQMAKQLFGDGAQTVMNHVQEIQRLERSKAKAMTELQQKASENQQREVAESTKVKEWAADAWRRVNTDLSEKNPDYFQADPKDKERSEIFSKALQIVDARHNGKALTPIQQVTLDARVRLQAAGFMVAKYDNAKLKEENAELRAQIAEMKDQGTPGSTQRPGGDTTNAPAEKTFEQELQALEA